jgi:hypothetical protein
LLDEWGNAEQASLTRMSDCRFDFRLGDDGRIELAGIGEATEEYIMETCYPELQKAFSPAEGSDSHESQEQLRRAVERERTRLWDIQPPTKPAATELVSFPSPGHLGHIVSRHQLVRSPTRT